MAEEKSALLSSLDDMLSELLLYVRGEINMATGSQQMNQALRSSPQQVTRMKENKVVQPVRRTIIALSDLTNTAKSNQQSYSKQTLRSKISRLV